jgi:small subunit ribosomal protein S16
MVKIRLRRVGAKKQPHYRVVVADSRSPRDGKFLETIGHYNPRTEPPTMEIDEERALYWLSTGAQPSEAVKRMLDKLGISARAEAIKRGEVPIEVEPLAIEAAEELEEFEEEEEAIELEVVEAGIFEADVEALAEEEEEGEGEEDEEDEEDEEGEDEEDEEGDLDEDLFDEDEDEDLDEDEDDWESDVPDAEESDDYEDDWDLDVEEDDDGEDDD